MVVLPSFEFTGLSFQMNKCKIAFPDGGLLGYPIKIILAILDLQVAATLPSKFWVSWTFGSEEEQNKFSRRWPCWPYWISNRNSFSYIWSTSCPNTSYKVLSQIGLLFQEKKRKTDVQDGCHWLHLGLFCLNDFSYFLSTSCPNTSYQVSSQVVFRFWRRGAK